MSTYVSIGRNVGDEPMSAEMWRDFRTAVEAAVTRFAGPLVSATTGTGWYQGVSEETAVYVGAADESYRLIDALDVLRTRFGQESIAVTWGVVRFV